MGKDYAEEWRVDVFSRPENGRPAEHVHRVGCKSKAQAERVERAMQINLNHDAYYTAITSRHDDKESAQ